MAIPPPPPGPPGPPPPPIGNLKLGAPPLGISGGPDNRSALLLSIQQGAKLKKTTTVDKSGPVVTGRIANANGSNNNNNSSTSNSSAPSRPPPPTSASSQQTNGMPKLGGIFEGMTSMPKLKPVGSRSIGSHTSPSSESPSSAGSPQNSQANSLNGSGVMDFNAELTKHLTLKNQKKQQQQQQQQQSSPSESSVRMNRGPPPQPPNKAPSQTVTDNNSSSSNSSPLNGTSKTLISNKSSLFGSNNTADASNSSSNMNNSNSLKQNANNPNAAAATTTNKQVPNYGKPNCAPKPPGIQLAIAAKNGTTTNNISSNGPTVSRHHSMRAPRSPPLAVVGNVFPAQHFGTMRGAPAGLAQSQESINSTIGIRQAPPRPTVAPPRPPVEAKAQHKTHVTPTVANDKRPQGRSKSPPPPPIRNCTSNTNLTTLPLSIASSSAVSNLSLTANASNNFGGSASNVASLSSNNTITAMSSSGSANNLTLTKERSLTSSSNNVAPPLPPHRSLTAPTPPTRQHSMTSSSSGGAPPIPLRVSSVRSNSTSGQSTSAHPTTPNSSRTANRFVVDLDSRFGSIFHNVTEFPVPSPFTKPEKIYPSQYNMKTTTETRKAKAPCPPTMRPAEDTGQSNDRYILQLDDMKMCANESYC